MSAFISRSGSRATTYGRLSVLLAAILLVAGLSSTASAQTWTISWADEFNGTGAANSADWTYETGGGGWGNGELEYYTGPSAVPPGGLNGQQSGGNFNIQLRQESYGGNAYTSTRLITKGHHNFGPGDATPVKFEARIGNVPKGQGTWPAFWMLGSNIDTTPWPDCGEIDILETINDVNTDFTTIHWNSGAGHAQFGPAGFANVNFAAFHVFGITWTPTEIRWWMDGVTNGNADITNNINSTEEFHRSFFALINVAIGGSWPGAPTSALVLPKTMNVDYVHYSTGGGGGGTPTPTTPPAATPTRTNPPVATPTATPVTSGSNLAQGRACTASSNLQPCANAFDGNTGTRWESTQGVDPGWIRVDLGSTQTINRVNLNWEPAYAKSFQIQTSNDGTTWTTIYTTTAGAGGNVNLTVSGSGRYVRMYGTLRATQYGYSLWEFGVYGGGASATPTPTSAPSAVLLSQAHPVLASSAENAGTAATNAVDGNTGTRWSSAFTDPQWIRVDLGAAHNVSRVGLNWEAAYGKAYQLQSSNDGTTWATFYTTTTSTGGNQSINVTANGRYIRMFGTARATQYGYSLWEFQVFGN
jgi:beta-glucanase (GH16 family)